MIRRLAIGAILIALGIAQTGCSGGSRRSIEPIPAIRVPDPKFDPFYTLQIDAGGIPILASSAVDPAALVEARRIILAMLAGRDDLIHAMLRHDLRIAIIGEHELTTDMPEYRDLNTQFPGTDWDQRARGLGATKFIPLSSVGEENLLALAGDRYKGENILVHEFAHSILTLGILTIDPGFGKRLDEAYDHAMEAGLWEKTYAATNVDEYWAEGVQSWFDVNREARPSNGVHNHVNTRVELEQYDPLLASLIAEQFANASSVSLH